SAMLKFAPLLAILAAGCLGSIGDGSSGQGSDAGAPPDLIPAVDVAAVFSTDVQPILMQACDACHNRTGGIGPGFLERKPDMLTTLLASPGLIGATPGGSRIYAKGLHEGPSFTPVQAPTVANWITVYNLYKPKPDPKSDAGAPKPTIAPFAPTMGANTV